jgi:hypothetical protein
VHLGSGPPNRPGGNGCSPSAATAKTTWTAPVGGIEVDTAAFAAAGGSAHAEAAFFSNMVLALDHYFLHRVRKLEGKDGNPLNEVRVLCDSLTENDGVFAADGAIKLKPEETVLTRAS